jgi:hypothetical protein
MQISSILGVVAFFAATQGTHANSSNLKKAQTTASKTWICKASANAWLLLDRKTQALNRNSEPTTGSTHIFRGVGKDIVDLTFDGETGEGDKLVMVSARTYIAANDSKVLVWRFFTNIKGRRYAIKYLADDQINGGILGFYECAT